MSEIEPFYPVPPPPIRRFVDILGPATTIEFLLNFGGAELYLSDDPKGRGMVERVIGYDKTKKLAHVSDDLKFRVPLGTKWLAQCLYAQGLSTASIARRLRRSDSTVRRYLNTSGRASR